MIAAYEKDVKPKVLISAASGWDDMVKTLGIIIYGRVPKEDFVKGKIKA
jgi:hypothetical protein